MHQTIKYVVCTTSYMVDLGAAQMSDPKKSVLLYAMNEWFFKWAAPRSRLMRMEAVKFKQFNRNNQDLYLLTLRIKQKSTIKIGNLKQKMNEQRNMRTSTAFTWTPSRHWVSRMKFHSSKCLLHDPSGFCTRRKTKMPVKFNDLHFIYCRFLFLSCAPIQWAFNMQLKIVQLKIKSELIHLMCIWTLRWDHCWRANVFIQNNFCLAAITLRLFLSWRFFHFSWFLLFWIILILI